jgi:hypothetical protein
MLGLVRAGFSSQPTVDSQQFTLLGDFLWWRGVSRKSGGKPPHSKNVGAPTFTESVDIPKVLLEGCAMVVDPLPPVCLSAGIIRVTGERTVCAGIVGLTRSGE